MCGAYGQEVQGAFNSAEELRDQRQREIVRIIMQDGMATAGVWEKH